jgi:hypothetical protein
MSVTVEAGRGWIRSALAALVSVAMLVPVGLLLAPQWRTTSDDMKRTRQERRAIEYLTRLGPLLTATAQAQAEAVLDRAGYLSVLDAATAGVAEADQRLGIELDTRERWSTLRRKIDELPDANGRPLVVFQAYVESSDLLLALYDAVRDNSALARDPDSDISHLQVAIAVDLPQAVVFASRLADLAILMGGANAAEQRQVAAGLAAAAAGANAAVDRLTDNLQQAVDDTASRTLSSALLAPLDRFRLGMEAVVRAATVPDGPTPGRVAPARTDLLAGVSGLSGAILTETDRVLQVRLDDLRERERRELFIAGVAALLAFISVVLPLIRRRRPTGPTRGSPDRRVSTGAPADRRGGDRPRDRAGSIGAEVGSVRRERSGALR